MKEGLNENFLAKISAQTQKIKELCKKRYPDSRSSRKLCIKNSKTAFMKKLEKQKGFGENFPDMSGGGGMGCRVPPADVMDTEERDEDNIVHPSMKWSTARKGTSGVDQLKSADILDDPRLIKNTRKAIDEKTGMKSRVPSAGLATDVEEGQTESNEDPKDINR